MWNVDQIVRVPVEVLSSSPDRKRLAATAVEAEGVRLVNAVELVVFESSATQVEICEGCGVPHCNEGGWIAIRRIGENVVWIPAWNEMEESSWGIPEFRPPAFLTSERVPLFSAAAWDLLRALNAEFPPLHDITPIDSREAARWCQWTAPGLILGEFPSEPRLHRDALLAVADRELPVEAELVDRFLHELFAAPLPMEPVPAAADLSPIEFWVDLPGTPCWKSFARLDDAFCCLVDGSLALAPGSSSH